VTTAYLGLGSNLGNREANLRQAVAQLAPTRVSSIYETAPMYVTDQPAFLNMVVELETALSPLDLLRFALDIEQQMGRQRTVAKGPRTIDIDVLLYGGLVMNTDELTLPHPGMAERRFVLEPLLELAPELTMPDSGKPIADLLGALTGQPATRRRTA